MKKNQPGRRWTKKEELILLQGVGANGLSWFERKTGRSAKAIFTKLRDMSGNGGLTRGSYTLARACRETGYGVSQLKRARGALRQKWKKTSRNGSYFITEDQLEELTDWLCLDFWSINHRLYTCVWCYKHEYRHVAYGLCTKCMSEFKSCMYTLGIKHNLASIRTYVEGKYEGSTLRKLTDMLDKKVMIPIEYLKVAKTG